MNGSYLIDSLSYSQQLLANIYFKVEDSVLSPPEVAELTAWKKANLVKIAKQLYAQLLIIIEELWIFLFLSDIPRPALHYGADVHLFFFFLPVTCFQMKSDIITDATLLPALHLILCKLNNTEHSWPFPLP